MKVELISITPNAEEVIETAGRTCYLSMPGNPSIICKWIKSKHESVLEHASATFRISEISRACSHQLVRHRLASFSQMSQRYTNGDNFGYTIPQSIALDKYMSREYNRLMADIKKTYKYFVGNGIKHEDARFILPTACHTELVISANFREWRHILDLRVDSHSQWEIRKICTYIGFTLLELAPNVFFDFEERLLKEVE